MSLEKKIKRAKKTNWLTKGFTDAEIKRIVEEAQKEARIQRQKGGKLT